MSASTYHLNDKKITLSNQNVIGIGGEATVFQHHGQAVKIYLHPTTTRDQKLRALITASASLPPNVIAPQQLVFDADNRQAVGFTMPLLSPNHTDLRQLSIKKYRNQTGYTSRHVADLFLNIYDTLTTIHANGMIAGDLNDLNIMFENTTPHFIDVDSFQFATFPCLVGTEAFIDPTLYNVDLSIRPHFTPQTDWYAFAVLLFKSLLLTHPYGGVHRTLHLLTARAQSQISVFHTDVIYPRIAYPPELLSDELTNIFSDWFDHGQRAIFPRDALTAYAANLTTCPGCNATYPANRRTCPICTHTVPVTTPQTIHTQTLLQTTGPIIAWRVLGGRVQALAHESGKVIYYETTNGRHPHRLELFNILPDATYTFLDNLLVISPSRETDILMLVDVSGDTPQPITQTTTAHFGGTVPIFGAGSHALYRLAGNFLMRGRIKNGNLIETAVLSVTNGQTWFRVNPTGDQVFGYFRFFNQYQYWLLADGNRVDADLIPLAPGEVLIELDVQFTDQTALIIRQTQHNGADHTRLDEIDAKGRRLNALTIHDATTLTPLDAHAYAPGLILRATDTGLEQRRLNTTNQKIFNQTEPIVRHGDPVRRYKNGIAILHTQQIINVTL